jgi:hypothetical protein
MRPSTKTLLALLTSLALQACGGSPTDAATPVEACAADLKPALMACVPHDYRGVDAQPIKSCVAANQDLTFKVVQCRNQSPEEFVRLMDNVLGHEAAYALSRL